MEKLTDYLNAERGRRNELAKALGISPSAISMWKGVVPAERAVAVERFTGIPREELNPRVFGRGDRASQRGNDASIRQKDVA